jgi:TolB-like protein/lipoprotein NlpI
MSFFKELKRRNVVRVAIAYLITAWLLLQIIDLVLENINAPDWVMQVFMLAIGVGFPVALILAWAFEMTPEGIKRERDVDRAKSITRQTGRKLDFAIIGVLAIGLVYFAWESRFSDAPEEIPSDSDAIPAETSAIPAESGDSKRQPKSIAVLPFVNMSDDAGNEYFSDGISEEILNALARVKELKVAGRTSSFAFKGQQQDLRQIGDTLGVEHILEGSVRKAGTKVRITAQLIQVEDGFHLWSDTFDRELTDVFAIQDEIASAILAQLKAQLLDEEVAFVSTPTDTRAYDLYLLARQRIYERNRLALEAAVELLDSAIAIDPEYAPAYAQRGIATLLLVEDQYGNLPQEQSDPLGKKFLDQALALDPDLAEALAGTGLYHLNRPREHEQTIEFLHRALAINPNMIDASNWLQIAYRYSGRPGEAIPIVEDMIDRDPLYRPGLGNAMQVYIMLGQQDKALALIEKVRPFMPNDPHLLNFRANVHYSLGELQEGLVLAERALRQAPDDGMFRGSVGGGLWQTHQYERLAELGIPFARAYALDVLGRTEEAMMIAYEEAGKGNIGSLVSFLNINGRSDDLIRFFDERWTDLDTFEADYPSDEEGHWLMLEMALAWSRAGDEERFTNAMRRIRAAHDALQSAGIRHRSFLVNEAMYFSLGGDHEQALTRLELAVNNGFIGDLRLSRGFPAFAALESDPRYQAIQSRMIENLNTQRAALGLEAATI